MRPPRCVPSRVALWPLSLHTTNLCFSTRGQESVFAKVNLYGKDRKTQATVPGGKSPSRQSVGTLPRGRFRADPGMNRVRERGSRSEVKQQGVGTAEYGCRTSDPAGADPRAATAAGGPGLFHGACHQTRQAGVCHTAAVRRLLFTGRGGNMAPLGENG